MLRRQIKGRVELRVYPFALLLKQWLLVPIPRILVTNTLREFKEITLPIWYLTSRGDLLITRVVITCVPFGASPTLLNPWQLCFECILY